MILSQKTLLLNGKNNTAGRGCSQKLFRQKADKFPGMSVYDSFYVLGTSLNGSRGRSSAYGCNFGLERRI